VPHIVGELTHGLKSHRRLTTFAILVIIVAAIGSWLSRGKVILPPATFAQCANAGYIVTDTNPPACLDGKRSFLGPVAKNTPAQAPLTSQPFQVLVDADSKGDYPRGSQVIDSQSQWETYWMGVHAWLSTDPPILPVNFATSDVLAVSEGHEATAGYVYEITSINTGASGTVADVSESIPTVTCSVAYTPTNPYYIVETAKLPTPVTFNVTTTHHECPS
jgi:hypothetical protein